MSDDARDPSTDEVEPVPVDDSSADTGPPVDPNAPVVEADLVDASEAAAAGDVIAERDDYRDALLRVKADFDNYKKRVAKEQSDRTARAAESLITALLPVLDASEAAVAQGAADVEPVHKHLLDVLTKEGLERMDDVDAPFDPARHEAVMHEEGDGEQVVAESLRTGYLWKGRVVRPAMVKVRG